MDSEFSYPTALKTFSNSEAGAAGIAMSVKPSLCSNIANEVAGMKNSSSVSLSAKATVTKLI